MATEATAEILIIDSDPEIRHVVSMLLKHAYETISAEDYGDAKNYLDREIPDLVIYDPETPDPAPANGLDVIHVIKNDPRLEAVPMVVLTGNQDPDARTRAFASGVDDYIYKPFEISDLLVRVKYLIKISMYQKMLAERNRVIEKELDLARMLQAKLLPTKVPQPGAIRMRPTYIPMDKVGGDYYDVVPREQRLDVIVADASGHGIPAAFLTSLCKMSFDHHSHASATCDHVITRMDRDIHERSVKNLFVTAVLVRLQLDSLELFYTNAGHCPPLLHRRASDEILQLEQNGTLPLGMLFERKRPGFYTESSIKLQPGDRLILYTDGVTECTNAKRELYGLERLVNFTRTHADSPQEEFSDKLVAELTEFAGTSKLGDDLTFLMLDVAT